jgi:hypothetical protein
MKNDHLYYLNITLAVASLVLASLYDFPSFIASLSSGYMASAIVGFISPRIRTKAQEEGMKRYVKTERIILITVPIIVTLGLTYYIFR